LVKIAFGHTIEEKKKLLRRVCRTSRSGASDFRKVPEAPSLNGMAELSAPAAPATIKKRRLHDGTQRFGQ
jgi:hypothetical protein